MSSRWYCVRTISGQEKKVKQYLETEIRRLHFDNYIEKIVIPIEKVFEIRNRKKIAKERPHLPGYIFVEFNEISFTDDFLQPEIVHMIKEVPGIVSFVGSEKGKTPVALRPDEIARIIGAAEELEEKEETLENPFQVGEIVRVTEGGFASCDGVIEEVNEERKKLKLMVKIFGRNTPLELGFLQVERK